MMSDFYKKNESDKIWWIKDFDHVGRHLFSFDRKKYIISFLIILKVYLQRKKFCLIRKTLFGNNSMKKATKNLNDPVE